MSTLFSEVASVDPIAQALHLPGSQSYANTQQQQQQQAAIANGLGPYSGVAPSLAGAQAGYAQGGPGAIQGWQPYQPKSQGGLLGDLQSAASFAGGGAGKFFGNFAPNISGDPTQGQAYGTAAQQAAQSVPKAQQASPFGTIQRAASGGISGY